MVIYAKSFKCEVRIEKDGEWVDITQLFLGEAPQINLEAKDIEIDLNYEAQYRWIGKTGDDSEYQN